MSAAAATEPVERPARLRRAALLAGVFLAALALRGAYLWDQARRNPFFREPVMDALVHHEWAQRIARGEGMDPKPYFRAPLYYYLLAGLYRVCGPRIEVGYAAGALIGSASCMLIALLGLRLAGTAGGLLAGLLAACYWPFIYYDGELLTVGLEVFLNVAALLLMLAAARSPTAARADALFLLSGLAWGLSAITRPTVLTFAPGFLLWLWLAVPVERRAARFVRAAAATALGGALAVLPVTVRNIVVGGERVLIATNGGVNFYIGNNPRSNGFTAVVPGTRADWWGGYEDTHAIVERALGRRPRESEVSDFWYRQALRWIAAQPGAWLTLTIQKFLLFWSPVELPNNQPIGPFVALSRVSAIFWLGFPVVASLGLASLTVVRGQWRAWLLLLAFFVTQMLTVVAYFCNGRYRLPVAPVFILLTAAGLCRLPATLRERRFGRLGAFAAVGATAAGLFSVGLPADRAHFNRYMHGLACTNLAYLWEHDGPGRPRDLARAIDYLRQADALLPPDPSRLTQLAGMLLRAGREPEAAGEIRKALTLSRGLVDDLLADAADRLRAGDPAQAEQSLRLALLARPGSTRTRLELCDLLARTGRLAAAVDVCRTGLDLAPDDPGLLSRLAWIRATAPDEGLRDGDEALRLALRAVEPSGVAAAGPDALDALAAACAETGRFDEAVDAASRALQLVRASGNLDRAARSEERLRAYREGRAWREASGGITRGDPGPVTGPRPP